MAQVFISYRRSTSAILAQLLRQEMKLRDIDAFVDVRDIESTGPFPEKLTQAIADANALVCLLAEGTLDSPWVQEEIRQAYEFGKVLIPVFQESYQAPPPPHPEHIKALLVNQGIQIFDSRGVFIEDSVNRLVTLLKPQRTESNRFSQPIKALHKTFEELTKDQFQIINTMRYQKRMRIAGCAGSGKTLIAAEKALRLDLAGFRTLILCHSAYLARYIQGLVTGTGVRVLDFTSWMQRILQTNTNERKNWNHFEEPTNEEISEAFDRLMESNERYDAIIVDEGQDFRNEWWIVIEAALANQEAGILYIFHDDNQALLPERSQYPFAQAPVILSKNCRNAGEVFELVRKFHPQLPETSLSLKRQGIVKQTGFTTGSEIPTVQAAVIDALNILSPDQLIVLTTEPEPIHESVLEGLTVTLRPKWRWQEAIYRYFSDLELSDEPAPTPNDIRLVRNAARKTALAEPPYPTTELRQVKWVVGPDRIILSHSQGEHIKRSHRFFQSDDWAKGIPRPKSVRITSEEGADPESTIRLFTVSSYKGLEADGAILFLPASRVDRLEANIYVGLSRARFLLHLLVDNVILPRIRQMQ